MTRTNGYLQRLEFVPGSLDTGRNGHSMIALDPQVTEVTKVTALDTHPLYEVARLGVLVAEALNPTLLRGCAATAVTLVTPCKAPVEEAENPTANLGNDAPGNFVADLVDSEQVTGPRLPAVTLGPGAVTRTELSVEYTLVSDREALDEVLPHSSPRPRWDWTWRPPGWTRTATACG
jgi:hypothetical protein